MILDRKELEKALSITRTVVNTRHNTDVLQNVLIEVSGGKCFVMGTDIETFVSCEISCDDRGNSRGVLLPIARLTAIVSTSVGEKVYLSEDGKISCGRSRFALQTADPADFPRFDEFIPDIRVTGLSSAIGKIAFVAENSGSMSYAADGIHFRIDENAECLVLEATDGRRLAIHRLSASIPRGFAFEGAVILPPKIAKLISRIGDEFEFQCKFDSKSAMIQSGTIRMRSRLIEGWFPRTEHIVPNAFEFVADCVSELLAMAATQALIVNQKDDDLSYGADFRFSENNLEVRCHGMDAGEADIEIPIVYTSLPISVRLNPRYVLDYLRHVTGRVFLKMNSPDDPVAMTNDEGYVYVVMPQYPGSEP